MSKTGFDIIEESKEQEFFLDNRLDADDVLFVIYLLGERLQKITLSNERPSMTYKEIPFSVVHDKVWVNGSSVGTGYTRLEDLQLLVLSKETAKTMFFLINEEDYFVIGSDAISDIKMPGDAQVVIHKDSLSINVKNNFLYFNQKALKGHHYKEGIQTGYQILTPDFLLEKRKTQWKLTIFTDRVVFEKGRFLRQAAESEFPEDFPKYRRSPRLHLEPPEDKFKIQKIEDAQKADKGSLLKAILPPVGMLAVTGLTTFLTGRNPIMLIGMGFMSLMTASFTISQFFSEKKERKIQDKARKESYEYYLINIVSDIAKKYDEETDVLNFKNPSPEKISEMLKTYDSRIYERMMNNKDFLEVSFGTGQQRSNLKIDSDINDRDNDDATKRVDELVNKYSSQRNVPKTIELTRQTLGLVGSSKVLTTSVSNLLLQVAFFHSYRDVNFISLVPEKSYRKDWAGWRFLPHFKLQELGMRGIIHDAKTRDMVLSSFYQLLNKRKQMLQEAGREKPHFAPHYILTIFDDSYLAGHGINEFLAEDMSDLAVTVIWAKEDQKQLPETVSALVEYKNQNAGEIINDNHIHVAQTFEPYDEVDCLESRLRQLSNLEHVEVEKNAVPESLSLLEQYDVKTIEDLDISTRWSTAEPNKSIKSLIGWRGKKEYMYWDLHERVHGPHALVGGTTGSGKSEFLTTYLIGLAINFSPEDIGMLIIDWKGGGIANTLAGLPHFMGSITNLDGAGTARALASIKAELDKRMKEFAKYGVNSINAYMTLYKQRLNPKPDINYPSQPIPHLILVSDEFAELKANVPEFLDELTSVARIGRSLGVHLILATQKPSGVVNDQIEANSTSKIALKMASEQDSNELLKTHDAAHITQPGRGYLKVGQNEVYELFQSGYAGIPYDPYAVQSEKVDERIYSINDLGQTEVAYDPGEEVVQGEDSRDLPTQLEAVIEGIDEIFKNSTLTLPAKPWLPNLETHIVSPEVKKGGERQLSIPLGLVDIPSEQAQKVYNYDIAEASHTVIFSSPGYGKSTTLQTIIMNLARQNTPEQVQFNLLDFGTNGLLPLKDLPHVSDIVTLEEEEKLEKVLVIIRQTLEERKRDFQRASATDYHQYEKKEKLVLPVLINVLDGYDALADDKRKEKVDVLITQILREGAALGVYLIMTANRSGAITNRMSSNIQTNIALSLTDDMEIRSILGEKGVPNSNIAGRGQLIVNEMITQIQIYLAAQSEGDTDYIESIIKEASLIDKNWTGRRPQKVPILPNPLTYKEVDIRSEHSDLILGYSQETTLPYIWNIDKLPLLLVTLDTEEQGYNFLAFMLQQFKVKSKKTVLIDGTGEYVAYENEFDEYLSDDDLYRVRDILLGNSMGQTDFEKVDEIQPFSLNFDLMAEFDSDDEQTYQISDSEEIVAIDAEVETEENECLAEDNFKDEEAIYYIPDFESVAQILGLGLEDMKILMKQSKKNIVFVAFNSYIAPSFEEGIKYLRAKNKIGMFGVTRNEQKQVPITGYLGSENYLDSNEFYAYRGRKYEKVRIPMEEENQ